MTHHDDFLDAGTAERLLAGTVAPADAPPGYGPTAAVLAAARAGVPVPAPNLAELARVAGESASQPGSPSQTRRSPVLVKLLTVKAAAAAGVILLGATGAAAATGSLPGAAQGVAHRALSKVGVDVPDDANHSTEPAESSDETKDSKPDESTSTTLPAGDQPPPGVPAGTSGSDDPANHDAADSQGDDQSNDSADDQGQDAPDAGTGDQSDDGGSDHSGSGSGSSDSGGSDSSGGGQGGQD